MDAEGKCIACDQMLQGEEGCRTTHAMLERKRPVETIPHHSGSPSLSSPESPTAKYARKVQQSERRFVPWPMTQLNTTNGNDIVDAEQG